jgi:predicted transcriptional regulator
LDDLSEAARAILAAFVVQYRDDAARVPERDLRRIAEATGPDPVALAARFPVPHAVLFRRLACLSGSLGWPNVGLASCDASGTLIFRKAPEGFPLPTFRTACPLWPLFEALSRPAVPLRRRIVLAGRPDRVFQAYAVADPEPQGGFDAPPILRAHMLLLPDPEAAPGDAPTVVGTSCRICPRAGCRSRREPSVVGETA